MIVTNTATRYLGAEVLLTFRCGDNDIGVGVASNEIRLHVTGSDKWYTIDPAELLIILKERDERQHTAQVDACDTHGNGLITQGGR